MLAVEYSWYNEEKSIVYFQLQDPWTTVEFSDCEMKVREVILHSNQVVDAILDFNNAKLLPQSALSYFMSSLRKGETITNEGVSVVIGANMLIHVVGNTLRRVTENSDIYFANDLAEAEEILRAVKQKRKVPNP